MKVVFTPSSDTDLSELYDYIADNASLRIAADYVVGIQTACMALADFPLRGAARPDLGNGIRTIPFQGRAVIAYRPGDDRIRILRVFAAGRDYGADDFAEFR